jgi:hypothetical protein
MRNLPPGQTGVTVSQFVPNQPGPVIGPNLPLGGDYGAILAYFVERGRPTYGFADLPPNMAVVAVELFFYVPLAGVEPAVYLFLDSSLVPQYWYYVYRYVSDNIVPPDASVGPVSGSPGSLVLISGNVYGPPNQGLFPGHLPPSQGATPSGLPATVTCTPSGNPFLTQVTLGTAPFYWQF